MTAKTPEQIAAEAQAAADKKAQAAADKAAAKAAKDAAAQLAKQEKANAAAAAKAAAAAAKQAKADEKAKAAEEAKAAKAAKAAVKQPEQNSIVRPKADTNCGKIWAIADSLSAKIGAPVTIKALDEIARAEGYNEATIKTQYARWRKFHGVTGRLVADKPATETPAEGSSAAAE